MLHERRPRATAALLLAALLPACGDDGGFQPPRETASPASAPHAADSASAPEDSFSLEWDLPPGWSALPTSSFRQANFRLPGSEKAECYLTLLGGEAGGLESNVTRWRGQIGLPPLPAAEIAGLPHVPMLGREGVLFDFAGTWKGMSGSENEAGWRLLGVLQIDPAGSAFFKMYGPEALIESEKANFLALARSLRPAHAHPAPAAKDAPPPPMDAKDPSVASMAGDQQGITCTAPSTWTKGPAKATRVVTYQTPGGGECYVTVMGGQAGGIGGNVNRWRDQLGLPALPAEELEKLELLPMLGNEGRFLSIEGAGAKAGTSLLGALVQAGERMVFVKLTGPKDAVQKELDNFKAFAQSLKESR